MSAEKQIVVDKVVLVCNGCLSERVVTLDKPMRGAQELIEFIKTKVTRWCQCGAKTCDIKAYLADEN